MRFKAHGITTLELIAISSFSFSFSRASNAKTGCEVFPLDRWADFFFSDSFNFFQFVGSNNRLEFQVCENFIPGRARSRKGGIHEAILSPVSDAKWPSLSFKKKKKTTSSDTTARAPP